MYELVVFDLDGTIVDSSEGIFNSIRYVQKKLNLKEISEADMRYHLGPPMKDSYKRNFELDSKELELAVMYHTEYSLNSGVFESKIYDGVRELLAALKLHGVKTAVATMKPDGITKKLLNYHNLSFNSIHGHLDDLTKKDLIKLCMTDFPVGSEDVVMIGDTKSDMESAYASGVDFIGVSYGYGFKPGDSNCVSSPFELTRILLGGTPL